MAAHQSDAIDEVFTTSPHTVTPSPRRTRHFDVPLAVLPLRRERAVRVLATIVACIATIVLAGWAFDVPALRAVIPGAVQMKANTALGLLACAVALALATGTPAPARERAAQALGGLVALLGLATLSQYVFGWNLLIDELVFRDSGRAFNDIPGRMSPYTAVTFVAAGLGIASLPRAELRPLVWVGAAFIASVGVLSAIGYAWNVAEIVTDRVLPPVALNTALAMMMIGAAMWLASGAAAAHLQARRTAGFASLEIRVLIGFVAAIVLLLAAGAFTYRSSVAFTQALEQVARAQAVHAALGRLESRLAEAKLEQRQFLFTQDTEHHLAYSRAATAAVEALRELLQLVANTPEQMMHARSLGTAMAERLRNFDTELIGSGARNLDSLRELVALVDPSERAIRAALSSIDAREAAVLESSRHGVRRVGTLTFASLLLTLAVAAGVMAFLFRGIRAEVLARREVERFDKCRHDVLRVFATCSTRREALARALGEVTRVGVFRRATLYVADAVASRLVLEASDGEGEAPPVEVTVSGPPDDAAFDRALAAGPATAVHAIRFRGRLLGVLELRASAPLADRERDFARRIGDELGIALSHFEQFLELRALSSQLAAKNDELSRQAAALEQASRMKTEFLATMSHELRTPLNAIIGFAEVLRDGLAGSLNEEQREFIGEIQSSGEHLLELINDILDLSKVEAGKMELSPEPVAIETLLRNSLAMVRERAQGGGVALDIRIEPDLPLALFDARRLKQIVYNLLANAVKFTPEGGCVTLAGRRVTADGAAMFELTVRDTGIGISPADQARLFEPFVQIDSSLQKRFEGTGLGLAMVRRLAELHAGSVTLESAPGAGSTFTVRLPWRDIVPAVAPAATAQPSPSRDRPLALVVDDDERARTLLKRHLESAGLDVVTAADGKTAMTLAADRVPDLITLDIVLPGENGWDVLRALRAHPTLRAIPVIVVSIVADERDARALGAVDALRKPIARNDLLAALVALGLVRPPAAPIRALVIDEDARASAVYAAFLEGAGCSVLSAERRLDGIRRAREDQPDVVVLDCADTDLRGFDVIGALKAEPLTADIPIIVVTATALTVDQRETLQRSAAQVLHKTALRADELMAEVHRAVGGTARR